MRQSIPFLRAAGLACALSISAAPVLAQHHSSDSAVPPAVAKQQKAEIRKGDPARWYRGDNTKQQRMAILKKEINAAYAQQKQACNKMKGSSRSSCLKDARVAYQHDMSAAPALLAQGPTPEIVERVNIDVTAPGATQVGGSQGGATGAGTPQDRQQQANPPSGESQSDQSGRSQSDSQDSGQQEYQQPPAQ